MRSNVSKRGLGAVLSFAAACAVLCLAFGCGGGEENRPDVAGTAGPGEAVQPLAAGAAVPSPDQVIVELHGKRLTRADLERRVERFMKSPRMPRISPQELPRARRKVTRDVLQGFVVRHLLLHEAQRQGVEVDPAQVDQRVAEVTTNMPPDMTVEKIAAANNMTVEQFRDNLEGDLLIEKLIEDQVAGLPEVTDAEIGAYYHSRTNEQFKLEERVRARHLLVKCDAEAGEDEHAAKKQRAEDLRHQLLEGADFAELAKEHSDGPSGARGGDLGTFDRGRMVPEFDAAAFSQEVDEIGEVVKTQFGYHIVQVLEHMPAGVVPLEDVEERITAALSRRRQRNLLNQFVSGLEAEADIRYAEGWAPRASPAAAGEPAG